MTDDSGWILASDPNAPEPALGEVVEVVEHGDETCYIGVVIRPRKLWVVIPEREGHIADENSIERWRPKRWEDGK